MSAVRAVRSASRHTIIYGIGIVASKVVSLIMLPFYTRYLTPADYGVMQLVEMTIDVVSILAGTQIAQGIFRYYHKAESRAERESVLSTAFFLLTGCFGLASMLTILVAPALCRLVFGTYRYTLLVRLAAGTMFVQSLAMVPFAFLRLRERSSLFTVLSVGKLVLQVSMNIAFLAVLGLGLRGVFFSTLVANTLLGVALMVYLVLRIPMRVSKPVVRSLVRYGLPLVGTEFATFFSTFGDRYFLRVFGGETAVGIYGLAYQFGFILGTVGFTPFALMWEPLRFRIAKSEDRDRQYSQAFVHMNLILITAALGILLYVDDFIRIMSSAAFHDSSPLVPIILLAYIIQSWASFHETGILVRERTEFITLANVLAALAALAGYLLFIPRGLAYGAAWATVFSFAVRAGVTFAISQKLWPIRYSWGPIVRLLVIAGLVAAASLLAPRLRIFESLGMRTGLLAIYVLVVWLLVLTPEDRLWVRGSLQAIWQFITSRTAPAPAEGRAP
jgi:O-antigen/teichoic acid export membrane protein